MYHCVPRSISTMLPQPSETPAAASAPMTMGNSIGAGNDATICTTGCIRRDSRGERPIAIPAGSAHSVVSRSEEHTSELQSLTNLVYRLLLEKKKQGPR